jgi:hypothetical protein
MPFRVRTARPRVEDARKASGLIFSADDIITDIERRDLLEKISQAIEDTVKANFPETDNLEYAILKAHLLIEYIVEKYIESMSFYRVEVADLRFQFAQKVEMAAMLGFGALSNKTLPTIDLLNKSRNQVAHRFTVDRKHLDEAYRWWADDSDEVDAATDVDRIGFLKWFCEILAGETSGTLWAHALKSDSFREIIKATSAVEGDEAEPAQQDSD